MPKTTFVRRDRTVVPTHREDTTKQSAPIASAEIPLLDNHRVVRKVEPESKTRIGSTYILKNDRKTYDVPIPPSKPISEANRKVDAVSNCNQIPNNPTENQTLSDNSMIQASKSKSAQQSRLISNLETYHTDGKHNVICRDFLYHRCFHGSTCFRIHPRGVPKLTAAEYQKLIDQDIRGSYKEEEVKSLSTAESSRVPQKMPKCAFEYTEIPVVKLPVIHSNSMQSEQDSKTPCGSNSMVSTTPTPPMNKRSSVKPSPEHSLADDVRLISNTSRPPGNDSEKSANIVSNRYSDLFWDPQTGFWGYKSDDSAWMDVQSSTESTPVPSETFSTHTVSSQSSVTDHDIHIPSHEAVNRPVAPKHSETCRLWLRNQCPRGYNCDYVHGDIDYEIPKEPKSYRTFGSSYQNEDDNATHSKPEPPNYLGPLDWSVTVHDHAKAVIGPGFDMKEVVTGFETPWLFIGNIPSSKTSDDIIRLLEPFGRTVDIRVPTKTLSSVMTVKVRLSLPSEASEASAILNGAQVFGVTISARLPINNLGSGNGVLKDTAVRVQWEAPGKVAYCGYKSLAQANQAIRATRVPLLGSFVTAFIHNGSPAVGAVTVRFRGIPLDTTESDMKRFVCPEEIVWERANYTDLSRATNFITKILEENADLTSFEMLPPPHRDGMITAWAHFSSPIAAAAACRRLNGRKPTSTGLTRVFARHVQSIMYSLSEDAFNKIAQDVYALRASVSNRVGSRLTMSVIHRAPRAPVLVKLSGENIKELGYLKTEFEKILRGEILRLDGKVAWDGFFGRPTGLLFLQNLEHAHPGVSIQKDTRRRMITLFGSAFTRQVVRGKLLSKVVELSSQQIQVIPLPGRLIGPFMSTDLLLLQGELGPENVFLDVWNRALKVRGNDSAYEAARLAVHRARQRPYRERRPSVVECPVCFTNVNSPITLRCGHAWCRSCLANYLTSAIDNKCFPLTCLGNEARCPEPVPLHIAREILTLHNFESVFEAAFSVYVHSHADEFHYCPSPNCLQIYRTASPGTILQCPSCLLRICPHCHIEYHDGFDCQDRDGGDLLFKGWINNHDVKNCPGCKIPIERDEGCNHMKCTQCQTHICWVCMETFPGGEGIYGHMRNMHGGIGLGPVF